MTDRHKKGGMKIEGGAEDAEDARKEQARAAC